MPELERLFCCNCGKEVKPDAVQESCPKLPYAHDPGGAFVWCAACVDEFKAAPNAEPRPFDEEKLHRFVWSDPAGRTTDQCATQSYVGYDAVLATLSRLEKAGYITCDDRGDHGVWIARCAPWEAPPLLPSLPKYPAEDRPAGIYQGGPPSNLTAPDVAYVTEESTEPDTYADIIGEERYEITAKSHDDLVKRIHWLEQKVNHLLHNALDEIKRSEHVPKQYRGRVGRLEAKMDKVYAKLNLIWISDEPEQGS